MTRCLLLLLGFATLAACGGPTIRVKVLQPLDSVKKLSVVQFVSQWRNTTRGHTVSMDLADVSLSMNEQADMLVAEIADNNLFEAAKYNGNAGTAKGDDCNTAYICPGGWKSWSGHPSNAPGCEISPRAAAALAASQGADALLVVYTFWGLGIGMSKTAVVQLRFRLYDANGKLLAKGVTGGEENAGVFPGGESAVRSFAAASKRAFHEMAIRLKMKR